MNATPYLSIAATIALTALSGTAAAITPAQTAYGPSPYLSLADSPFTGLNFSYFYVDTFEANTVQPPGYTRPAQGLVISPGVSTDSVDADNGPIDGFGNNGQSWFSNASTETFVFTFDAGVLGTLPTHAGIVWTDVGMVPAGTLGVASVRFSAYDAGGNLIRTIDAANLGDGSVGGGTAEDRFFGMYYSPGISRIEISTLGSQDWEVDHLQYGALNPVPEPEQWLLMALGVGAVVGATRRRMDAMR